METRKIQFMITFVIYSLLFSSCEYMNELTSKYSVTEAASTITEKEVEDAAATISSLTNEHLKLEKELMNIALDVDQMFGDVMALQRDREQNGRITNEALSVKLKKRLLHIRNYLNELKIKAGNNKELVAMVEKLTSSIAEKEREINRLHGVINDKNKQLESLNHELRMKNAELERTNEKLKEMIHTSDEANGDRTMEIVDLLPTPNKGLFKGRLSREIEDLRQRLNNEAIRYYDAAIQYGSKTASYKRSESLKRRNTAGNKRSAMPDITNDVYYYQKK